MVMIKANNGHAGSHSKHSGVEILGSDRPENGPIEQHSHMACQITDSCFGQRCDKYIPLMLFSQSSFSRGFSQIA
jgi:hypothetical protein